MSRGDKNAEVMLTVNKIILGYLAAVTKTDAKIVVCNLRDLANSTVERLRQSNKYKTWSYITYPGTDMKMRVKVQPGYDHARAQADRQAYQNRFLSETGLKQPNYPRWSRSKKFDKLKYEADRKQYEIDSKAYQEAWRKWTDENPDRNTNEQYQVLEVLFDIKRQPYFSMSQHEIDTVLIEDILFMPKDDEEDDGRESPESGS